MAVLFFTLRFFVAYKDKYTVLVIILPTVCDKIITLVTSSSVVSTTNTINIIITIITIQNSTRTNRYTTFVHIYVKIVMPFTTK